MPKLHVVWDVERARPMSSPVIYGLAAQHADALETRFHRAFSVLPAPNGAAAIPL
jgi:hypothetical protein